MTGKDKAIILIDNLIKDLELGKTFINENDLQEIKELLLEDSM